MSYEKLSEVSGVMEHCTICCRLVLTSLNCLFSQEYKLFIGGLCPKTDTDSMSEYFTQYGELSDCVVMKDPTSKRSRGFGFVTFTEKSSFDKCMDKTNHEIDGRLVSSVCTHTCLCVCNCAQACVYMHNGLMSLLVCN